MEIIPSTLQRRAAQGAGQKRLTALLLLADIQVNGSRPWDIQVHDPRFFSRVLAEGSLGLGESYMEGWWDCPRLDEFFARILRAGLHKKVTVWLLPSVLPAKIVNAQSVKRSREVAERHYDLGNRLFECMLDPHMQYTCGYWRSARTLADAQLAKFELIAAKLQLEPGMEVLELGGGFGGLARYLAEQCGCRVVSYNISREQVRYARARCAGLPVEFKHADYREATGCFDRVVSVGLTEHIGPSNYRSYFQLVHECLKPTGLFLLHTIGANRTIAVPDRWFRKYIFPHGHLPSIRQLGVAMEDLLVMEDWHNFGADYDRTVMAWYRNVEAHWSELRGTYDEHFHRMWTYYLLCCAGEFRARHAQLWQIVLSKQRPGVYAAPR
jgi:cyclopropane-fatty-acyl-phospholipid synthase